ncbi:MAG: sarcosine oxidase subunit delta [Flavobacterium sp.]|jgi:sarcosine oxidase subunit delta
MKLLTCPLNGPRNISEFSYGGEYHPMPDDQTSDAREWAEYVFFHDNKAGVVTEWWFHMASAYWFLAERNTVTDHIVRTFKASELTNSKKQNSKTDGAG